MSVSFSALRCCLFHISQKRSGQPEPTACARTIRVNYLCLCLSAHLLLQPQYGIPYRAAQRPGVVAEGRCRGAAAEHAVGIQHRDGIGRKVERLMLVQTDLLINRRNQLRKTDRQVGYAAPQIQRLFHQLQNVPNGGVMPRKDIRRACSSRRFYRF